MTVGEQIADELYGLHCDIGRLEAENAMLREQVERLHADQAHWELGNCPSCPNVADLQEALEQNAKLRELVSKVEHYERLGCHECPYTDGCEAHTLYDEECPMLREIERMKRELGVEAD